MPNTVYSSRMRYTILCRLSSGVPNWVPCVCTVSPMSLARSGGLLSAPQQYMQQRVSWFKTNMTGGTMSALFNISNHYGEHAAAAWHGPEGVQGAARCLQPVRDLWKGVAEQVPSVGVLLALAVALIDMHSTLLSGWLQSAPAIGFTICACVSVC